MEACAGYLSSGFRIKNSEVCADIPMSLVVKIELSRLSPAADFNIFAVVLADGNALVRNIRKFVNERLLFSVQLGYFSVVSLDNRLDLVHSRHNFGDIAALFFDLRDFFACCILLLLEGVGGLHKLSAFCVDCKHLVNNSVHVLVSCFHCRFNHFGVFTDKFDI